MLHLSTSAPSHVIICYAYFMLIFSDDVVVA